MLAKGSIIGSPSAVRTRLAVRRRALLRLAPKEQSIAREKLIVLVYTELVVEIFVRPATERELADATRILHHSIESHVLGDHQSPHCASLFAVDRRAIQPWILACERRS